MPSPGSFTPGDIVTAADLNGLPAGILGETTRVSNFQTTSTSFIDMFSTVVNVPAGRKVKISAMFPTITHSNSGRSSVEITDGSNNRLQVRTVNHVGANAEAGGSMFITDTPSSGSNTYKLRVRATDAGTVTFTGGATNPIVLLVEDIGPV